jgi:hypothetical protein
MTRRKPETYLHHKDHPYNKDPVKGLATAISLGRAFLTGLLGALAALLGFAALLPLRQSLPWLDQTIAEGLVFSGSVAGLLLAMVLLSWFYMARPLRALVRERGLDPVVPEPAAERPNALFQAVVVVGLLALLVLMLRFEYHWRELLQEFDYMSWGGVVDLDLRYRMLFEGTESVRDYLADRAARVGYNTGTYTRKVMSGVCFPGTLLPVALAFFGRSWLGWWRRSA